MKILYINNFFSPYGGAEKILYNISSLMKNKRHDVYYYATDKQPYFEENYQYSKYFPKFFDKKSLSVKNPGKILKTFYNQQAKQNLIEYLKEIKPDVVNIHNIQFHLTDSVIDAIKTFDIPVIMHLHDPRLFCPGGTLSFKDSYCHDEPCIKGNPLSCVARKCKHENLKASVLSSLNFLYTRQKKFLDRVDAFICPSIAIKDLAVRAGVREEKLHVINHFISQEELDITPVYENAGYFLYVGRLDKEKGIQYLLEAMKNLSMDTELHIVGRGNEEETLKRMASDYGLNNVKFKGFMSGNDIREEYKSCIASILPCNWFETFGLTIIESFLHGKPVIASNIAAIPEIVEHNVNGLLVEPKNINQLCQAMTALLNNREKTMEMGRSGRLKLEKLYNSEVFFERYYSLLSHFAKS